MIPPLIVEVAIEKGIQLIAITDHNASANIWAVQKAAEGTGLIVLPGMELHTAEDVHCLCLFDTLDQIEMLQHDVDTNLPALENRPDFFGEQFVVDPTGDFIRREHRMLLTATRLTIKQAYQRVADLGGLFIPAHINRQAFGLMPTLGFIPPDVSFEAIEVSRHLKISEAHQKYPQTKNIPAIQNGDVHYLADFLGATYFKIAHPSIAEIRMAFRNENGRTFFIAE